MAVPVSTINARRSVRRFADTALSADHIERIRLLLEQESTPGPFGSTPRFAVASAQEMSELGPLWTYGIIRDAPSFVVGATVPAEGAMEDFGYRMEGIILEATALGLGTCWLGGTFSRRAAARLLPLASDENIPAVTPIGYPSERKSMMDGAVRFVARSSTRLPFEQLFFDGSFDTPLLPDSNLRWHTVLECVRRGPSASNKQPWRIVIERRRDGDRLHLYFAEDRIYNAALGPIRIQNIDLGIAMRHVTEAAGALEIAGAWTRLPDPPVSTGGAPAPVYVATWLSS